MPDARPLALAALAVALLVPAGAAAQPAPAAAPAPAVGKITFVRNQVQGTPPAGTASPLAVGDPLVLAHFVETAADSGARMTVGQGGSLSLGAKTRLTLDEVTLGRAQAGRSKLSLAAGTLRLKLDALFQGAMEVETPTAVVGIKGTELLVEATPTLTVVTVFEGVVTVWSKAGGEAVEVSRGHRTVVPAGQPPSPPTRPKRLPEGDPAAAEAIGLPTPEAPPRTEPKPPSKPPEPARPQEPSKPSRPADPGKPQEPSAAGRPRITGCASRGQAGESVCVCGSFGEGRAAKGLTLDGRPASVVSVAPTRLLVSLPEELAPGEHVVAGDPRAGFSAADRCRVEVLVVEAEYREHLKQGRSTYLTLTVRGSRERLRIRLQNLSPTIVRVKGGTDQVVTTRGGRNNSARVRVKAIGDGQARIRHQIEDLATCPCGS